MDAGLDPASAWGLTLDEADSCLRRAGAREVRREIAHVRAIHASDPQKLVDTLLGRLRGLESLPSASEGHPTAESEPPTPRQQVLRWADGLAGMAQQFGDAKGAARIMHRARLIARFLEREEPAADA